jgi:hypothetical protein
LVELPPKLPPVTAKIRETELRSLHVSAPRIVHRFCFTDKLIARCEVSNLQPTHDGLGHFGFNNSAKACIEVMSFDGLVSSAPERNRAFFDKPGLPT